MIYLDDLLADVQHDLGNLWRNVGNEFLLKAMDRACREIQQENKLSFLLETEGKIFVRAAYAATIVAAPNSTTLTLSGKFSDLAPVYWQTICMVYLPANTQVYRVADLDTGGYIDGWLYSSPNTSLKLQDALENSDLTDLVGATAYIYQDRYALPADCGYNDELIVTDRKAAVRLRKCSDLFLEYRTNGSFYILGNPLAYQPVTTRWSGSTYPDNYDLNWVSFWPPMCTDDRYLTVHYFKSLYTLSKFPGGLSRPVIQAPKEFRDVFYWKLMSLAYEKAGSQLMGQAEIRYSRWLRKMAAQNNADLAWEANIEEYPEGTIENGPYFNVQVTLP